MYVSGFEKMGKGTLSTAWIADSIGVKYSFCFSNGHARGLQSFFSQYRDKFYKPYVQEVAVENYFEI